MVWEIKNTQNNPEISSPILLAGLPGIGNVSKIAIDFIIKELHAKKIADIESHFLPSSVFVNDDNLIEIPGITIHHKKVKNQDFLFLTGDAQPIDEPSTYQLCEKLLDYLKNHNCKEIVCLAGIGLQHEPKIPKIYCTANEIEIIKRYKKEVKLNNKISGVVGPIIGLSGLLPGLAGKRKLPSIILLAETFAHPLYVGIKGSKELVKVLDKKFSLGIKLKNLDKDIKDLEKSVKKHSEDLNQMSKVLKEIRTKEIKYIG